MSWIEAIILGIIQGLTEFLPVSSSGHLEIGNVLLNTQVEENLTFAIIVHGATVLSTIVVFWKDIGKLLSGFFKFQWNDETQYLFKIGVSMIPVVIVGVFFKDQLKELFSGNIMLVGSMLLITAALLTFAFFAKSKDKKISFIHAFIIGIAQAIAVLPGISRSGATIATGLLLGNKKEEITRFSFLMVLLPILAANFLDLFTGDFSNSSGISGISLLLGFISAFVAGYLACKWMIKIVRRGKLIYFGIYCFIVGVIAIIFS